MRHSRTGDQTAEAIAFVVARAFWVQHMIDRDGPHRGKERELAALQTVVAKLAEACPSSIDEAYALAHDHHEYATRDRGDR